MSPDKLIKKLRLHPGQNVLIINSPPGYIQGLRQLAQDVQLKTTGKGKFDFVHFFAKNSTELNLHTPQVLKCLKHNGVFWISYPKKSSKIETDLTRDEGWSILADSGYRPISQISIDDDWSAVRFRPIEHTSEEDKIRAQYAGKKAGLIPIYAKLVEIGQGFGGDVALAPRKTYVALTRKKQFAVIKPSTISRIDLGLKLKGELPSGRLETAERLGSGSMTHKFAISNLDDIDDEVVCWFKQAYNSV